MLSLAVCIMSSVAVCTLNVLLILSLCISCEGAWPQWHEEADGMASACLAACKCHGYFFFLPGGKNAVTLASRTHNSKLKVPGRDFSALPTSEKARAFQMSETRCGEIVERRS